MKVLLDENIDVRFKNFFPKTDYDVYTVRDMAWNGFKNGALLKLLGDNNFDYWIIVDKNLPYQQNLANLPCSIIVLDVPRNTLQHLTPLLPRIFEILSGKIEKDVIVIPSG